MNILSSPKLTSYTMDVSENNPESPHPGEIKRMRKQCVPGALSRAGYEANDDVAPSSN